MNRPLLLAFTALLSLETFSQIITDRPDQTESSSTIPVNSLQLETGFVWESIEQGEEKVFAGPSVLLRYSINRIVELRAFNQYENH
ncbi:MAG: transporter, partial [Mangrovimonas sp.]|nr:transporter [Mangrovimonas sp.]